MSKILIMGAGALGSAVGGFFAKAGNEVTFVGREKHILEIQKDGLKISGIWGEHVVNNIIAKTDISNIPVQDLILITTKSTDTKIVAERIKPLVGKDTIIVSLQNGIGNEEILQEICGKEKVLGGMVIIGFELLEYGHVKVTVFADKIKIGEMNYKLSERVEKVVKIFNDANLPTDGVDNIKQLLWGKVLYNSCLNPLGAILDVNYGKLIQPNTWSIIQQIIKEIFMVAKKEMIGLSWKNPEEYEEVLKNKLLPATASHHSSMLYDIRKGRKTEIDFLNGKIVELGLKHSIPTPVNSMLCNLIKFKESLNQ